MSALFPSLNEVDGHDKCLITAALHSLGNYVLSTSMCQQLPRGLNLELSNTAIQNGSTPVYSLYVHVSCCLKQTAKSIFLERRVMCDKSHVCSLDLPRVRLVPYTEQNDRLQKGHETLERVCHLSSIVLGLSYPSVLEVFRKWRLMSTWIWNNPLFLCVEDRR